MAPQSLTSLVVPTAPTSRAAVASSLLHAMQVAHRETYTPFGVLSSQQRQLLHDAEAEAVAASPAHCDAISRGALYERAATDGELLDGGVETLLRALRPSAKDGVFLDLGSGRGGALFRVAAMSEWRHCFGVELMGSKHAAASHALNALQGTPLLRSPISVLRGDVLDLEEWAGQPPVESGNDQWATTEQPGATSAQLSEVTHAYTCSVCFDDFLLRGIARSLANRTAFPRFQSLVSCRPPSPCAPSGWLSLSRATHENPPPDTRARCAQVSLRELPSQPHLTRIGELSLECSWNAAVRGHVYVPADLLERDAASRAVPLLAHCLCADGTCALPPALQPWPKGKYLRLPK